MSSRSPLLDMAFGYMPAQLVHTAAELRVADALADGPRTGADLAERTGAHAPSMYRLLRGLACLGVGRAARTGPVRPHRRG